MKDTLYDKLIAQVAGMPKDVFTDFMMQVTATRDSAAEAERQKKIEKTVVCLRSAVGTLIKLEGAENTCQRLCEMADKIEEKYL